ncbi:MAG: 30S ribosomal protein S4 [Anaplasmataceae bacterium]|nr:30S ribosomal protein S4 [Anaplasmataceae bacterium]
MRKVKEKRERFLRERLQLKGERSASPKAAIVRKPYPPGQHGPNKKGMKLSEFGRQIREKQKFKLSYGLTEKTLLRLFTVATKDRLPTAQKMMELFERRLDNVVFRLGFTPSRNAARAFIRHGHIQVNGKTTSAQGFLVDTGDVIGFREGSKAKAYLIKNNLEVLKRFDPPVWLSLNPDKIEGKVLERPREIEAPYDISLLVQSFSK